MNFRQKIYWVIFSPAVFLIFALTFFNYRSSKTQIEDTYIAKYSSLSSAIADSLYHLEMTTDLLSDNSVTFLREYVQHHGVPSNEVLAELARKLKASRLYVIDDQGRFIRDSNLHPESNTTPLFDFCSDYRKLITGESNLEQTPILTTMPLEGAYKFTMASMPDRKHILEIGVRLSFIGDVLTKMMEPDPNILSVGLFTPSGSQLGYISRAGTAFTPGVKGESLDEPMIIDHKNHEIIFQKNLKAQVAHCCECKTKNLTQAGSDDYFYTLRAQISTKPMLALLRRLQIGSLMAVLIAVGLAMFLAQFLSRFIVARIAKFNEGVNRVMESGDLGLKLNLGGDDELTSLARSFDQMTEQLKKNQEEVISAEKDKFIVNVASQLAHDIQSPVAAVSMVAGSVAGIDEEKRLLLRQAAERIRSISNSLLRHARGEVADGPGAHGEEMVVCNLAGLVTDLFSEKKVVFSTQPRVELFMDIEDRAYALFSRVNSTELKRGISNALNNSFEAVKERGGTIRLSLRSDENEGAVIEIADDGMGIPPDAFPRIFERGFSTKKDGHGLGLSHLNEQIKRWGGRCEIRSVYEKGTWLILHLKVVSTPRFFAKELDVSAVKTVYVCDDDTLIHDVWEEKFTGAGVRLVHWMELAAAEEHFRLNPLRKDELLLMDHEFIAEKKLGLDFIERAKLQGHIYLVTGRYDDPLVLERCEHLGVKLLPKISAASVPIKGPRSTRPSCVLVDDDLLVAKAWSIALGDSTEYSTFSHYPSSAELYKNLASIPTSSHFYIDLNLKESLTGEDIGRALFAKGYRHLYLCTGQDPSSLLKAPCFRAITSKTPKGF